MGNLSGEFEIANSIRQFARQIEALNKVLSKRNDQIAEMNETLKDIQRTLAEGNK